MILNTVQTISSNQLSSGTQLIFLVGDGFDCVNECNSQRTLADVNTGRQAAVMQTLELARLLWLRLDAWERAVPPPRRTPFPRCGS